MKKSILIAACLVSLTAMVKAQDATPTTTTTSTTSTKTKSAKHLTPEQRAQKQVDAISSEITLSDDQKPKIYELSLSKATKMDEIKAKYKKGENKTEKDAELKAVRKEYHKNVKALLTPEQLEKLKAVQKEKKAAGKQSAIDAND